MPEISLGRVTSSGSIELNEIFDHEYEDVSKYYQKEADHRKSSNPPPTVLQSNPPPLPLRDNYKLTECSAYHTMPTPSSPTSQSENQESEGGIEVTACIAYDTPNPM